MIRYFLYAAIALGAAWFFVSDWAGLGNADLAEIAPAHAEKAKYIDRKSAILACFDVLNPNAQQYVYRDWVNRNKRSHQRLLEMVTVEFENARPSERRFILENRSRFQEIPTFKSWARESRNPVIREQANKSPKPHRINSRALELLGGTFDAKSCQALNMQVRRGELDIDLPAAVNEYSIQGH